MIPSERRFPIDQDGTVDARAEAGDVQAFANADGRELGVLLAKAQERSQRVASGEEKLTDKSERVRAGRDRASGHNIRTANS
jgi:hypothetical protein